MPASEDNTVDAELGLEVGAQEPGTVEQIVDNLPTFDTGNAHWTSWENPLNSQSDNSAITGRAWLADTVPWTVDTTNITDGSVLTSPNLAGLLNPLVARTTWPYDPDVATSATGVLVLDVKKNSGDAGIPLYDRTSANPPKLTVSWGGVSGPQKVGIRFPEVSVPRGATITNAYITFTSVDARSGALDLNIDAEYATKAEPFAADAGNISARPLVSANAGANPVNWNITEDWAADTAYQSPDISGLLQPIVNRDDWCGNSMALVLSSDNQTLRNVFSYEGNSNKAPVLNVEIDATNAAGSCVEREITKGVVSSSDDAEEVPSTDNMYLTSQEINLADDRLVGLRFQYMPMPHNSKILEAELSFSASANGSGAMSLQICGQKVADAGRFTLTDLDISGRALTDTCVNWNVPEWKKSDVYSTAQDAEGNAVDLAPVIQEIVSQADWETYNNLALIMKKTSGSGSRVADSYDDDPMKSAILRIRYQGLYDPSDSGVTVREYLMDTVRNMYISPNAERPLVNALFEAAVYYAGEGVQRGGERQQYFDAVSHVASHDQYINYIGGSPPDTPIEQCDMRSPIYWTDACNDIGIVQEPEDHNQSNNATYISPIGSGCQTNHIVLVTDGEASHPLIGNAVGQFLPQSCDNGMLLPDGFGDVNNYESCGGDIADFIANYDQVAGIPGSTVKVHTIGFQSEGRGSAYLKLLAEKGNGQFYPASDAETLVTAILDIIAQAMTESTSFASPALSVNAFTKLFHNNEVYFSLFKPENKMAWNGNVKKFKLCDQETITGCALGEILDANNQPAIISDPNSDDYDQIRDDAMSLWNGGNKIDPASGEKLPDGGKVTEGGAGAMVPSPANRTIYVEIDADTTAEEINCSSAELDSSTPNEHITAAMLGVGNETERKDLIEWICGYEDYTDVDNNILREWRFGDPLHSPPGPVTYGGSTNNLISKIFVATNEGGVRMLNGETGAEEWVFIPEDMLAIQKKLRENAVTTRDHQYGMDGIPTFLLIDHNYDGMIDPANNDAAYMFIGMRRGGRNIYAFDITPDSAPASGNVSVTPELLWTLEGGTGDFERLGQTWSPAKPAKVRYNGEEKIVLAFGGGYSPDAQDQAAVLGKSTEVSPVMGNAIYLVDLDLDDNGDMGANAGSLLWWASNGTSGADLKLTGMDYPIPSELALIDSDGDTASDRIYVGDTGGQVWRIDLTNNFGKIGQGGEAGIGGMLASLADQSADAADVDKRRFFYPPDVVFLKDLEYTPIGEENYDLVLISSGYRSHPLDKTIHDRFYAIRDRAVNGLVDLDEDSDGLQDPASGGGSALEDSALFLDEYTSDNPALYKFFTVTNDKLYDATEHMLHSGDGGTVNLEESEELTNSLGWYVEFKESSGAYLGEKGLASPIVMEGKVFFTTYVPAERDTEYDADACTLISAEGYGRLYALDILTGEAALNLNEENDETMTDEEGNESTEEVMGRTDRMEELGEGIPPAAQGVYQKKGITLLVGKHRVDNIFQLPRSQVYWVQE